jgi:hypothetical protein
MMLSHQKVIVSYHYSQQFLDLLFQHLYEEKTDYPEPQVEKGE